jgi:hypothetical protein
MSQHDGFRSKIDALAPDQTTDAKSIVTLADLHYAFTGGIPVAFGVRFDAKELPEKSALAARCLELMEAWLPHIDIEMVRHLEDRLRDRKTPIVLTTRKAELKGAPRLPDRTVELAAFAKLPALNDYDPVGALYVEDRIALGENQEEQHFAVPGVWLVYHCKKTGDARYDQEVLAVSAAAFDRIPQFRDALMTTPGELYIGGARMAVADYDAAQDPDWNTARFHGGPETKGRIAIAGIGGYGYARTKITREDGLVTFASIEIR